MQPITQASLDPKLNNIRHLRAEQEFCGVIGCFGLVSPHPHLRTSLTYSQSYRLHGRGSWPNRGYAKPQCFGDSRDSKNDSIFGARREIQRRRRHAPSCMGATELQSNWPDMRKTLGKPGFCSGEDRNRTFGCLPWFLKSSRDGDKSLRSQKTMHRTGNLFSITEQSEQRYH